MKKRIRSCVPVLIEVEFDYDPYAPRPIENIRQVSDWGQDMSTEVEKDFYRRVIPTINEWLDERLRSKADWEDPYTYQDDDLPPAEVCGLYQGAPVKDLREAWRTK